MSLRRRRSSGFNVGVFFLTLLLAGSCATVRQKAPLPRNEAPSEERPAAAGVRFIEHDSLRVELKVSRPGQPLVHPEVNGKDLGWFVLDTGAGAMAITEAAAHDTKMLPGDIVQAVGVGGSVRKRTWSGESFRLGPVVLDQPRFVEVTIPFSRLAFGTRVVGAVGFDLFASAVVDIDFPNRRLRLHRPEDYILPDGGRWTKLVVYRNLPCIECRFESGHDGLFVIDTGFNGTVTFFPHTVNDLNLLANRKLRRSLTIGAGGAIISRRGSIASFEIGEARHSNLEVNFETTARDNLAADHNLAGVIGVKLLSESRVVIDYSGTRFALLPSE